MDLIDKKIICELDLNCRRPLSQIAKQLRISRNVIDYRIKSMEKTGIIKNYICSVNLGLFGYKTYKIYFKIHSSKEKDEDNFIKFMISSKKIIHFLKIEGSYDYAISIAVKSVKELDDFLTDIKTQFKDLIKDYLISIVVYSRIFKLNKLLLNEKEKAIKIEKYAAESGKLSLDDKDLKILEILSQSANLPILDVAEKSRLSLDIVKYRIKNISKNLILSYRALFDISKLGFYHYVFMLKTNQATREDEERISNWCIKKKNVLYYTKRIGSFDFEINAAITDINDLNDFISELKTEFKDIIDSYELIINSRLLKLNYIPF